MIFLFKALYSLPWDGKEEILNQKFSLLLSVLEHLGLAKMKYFNHWSLYAMRETFLVVGQVIFNSILQWLHYAKFLGVAMWWCYRYFCYGAVCLFCSVLQLWIWCAKYWFPLCRKYGSSYRKFVGCIYTRKYILPVLSQLGKMFQRGCVNFSHISPAINHAQHKLQEIVDESLLLKHVVVLKPLPIPLAAPE